jgi:hypothetical protein
VWCDECQEKHGKKTTRTRREPWPTGQ